MYEFLAGTFKDEMQVGFAQFINTPLQKKIWLTQIDNINSVWWDNVATKDIKETRQEIITKSFQSSIAFLGNQLGESIESWTWNRVASVEYKHSLGEVALLRKYFNVGPFETVGGNEVINNQIFNLNSTGYYKIHAGPSTRRVIDFSDIEHSLGILPTGQSGNVFSPHYKYDQL